MNNRYFLFVALLALLALVFGYPQLAVLIGAVFVVSGIAFLIQRWDEKRIGKRFVTIKTPKTTPPQ